MSYKLFYMRFPGLEDEDSAGEDHEDDSEDEHFVLGQSRGRIPSLPTAHVVVTCYSFML
jgi:hypothetical protein